MIVSFFRGIFCRDRAMAAEYAPYRKELRHAGLKEARLRRMDPDERGAVLEEARLDPYDYIYLAC